MKYITSGWRQSFPARGPAPPELSHAEYASGECIPVAWASLGLQHLAENTERVASDNLG
jgi:hypothetical protein